MSEYSKGRKLEDVWEVTACEVDISAGEATARLKGLLSCSRR